MPGILDFGLERQLLK